MKDTYSLYEAKSQLSAIVRRVREGHSAIVTVHGRPVAEIRPIEAEARDPEDRLRELVERGVVTMPEPGVRPKLTASVRRPGALKRFLADRNR